MQDNYLDQRQPLYSEQITPVDFSDDFGIAIAKDESEASSPALNLDDLVERYSLFQTSLKVLDKRIRDRAGYVHRHKESINTNLKTLTFDLEEHLRVWKEVEGNSAAASRRTFLQGQAIRLQEDWGKAHLEELDKSIELEKERDKLLLEYVRLRRVVEALR